MNITRCSIISRRRAERARAFLRASFAEKERNSSKKREKGKLTGVLECSLINKSPLFIPEKKLDKVAKGHSEEYFLKENDKVIRLMTKFLQKNEIPGLSLSISYKKEIIFSKGFGFSDLKLRKEVNPSKTKSAIS